MGACQSSQQFQKAEVLMEKLKPQQTFVEKVDENAVMPFDEDTFVEQQQASLSSKKCSEDDDFKSFHKTRVDCPRKFEQIQVVLNQSSNNVDYLFENNRKWAAEMTKLDKNYFKDMSRGQKPKYLIISCADSRVPPLDIFGLKPGECFVHRNVANLVSRDWPHPSQYIIHCISCLWCPPSCLATIST